MNLYGDSRDSELKLRIGTGDNFTYDEIEQFVSDGLLEDYDLFKINSDRGNDLFVFYQGGTYHLITKGNHITDIDKRLLVGKRFMVASRSITNNLQHHVQLYGMEALEGLDELELVKIIMRNDFKEVKHIELSDLAKEVGLDDR